MKNKIGGLAKKFPTVGKITPISDVDGVVRLGEIVISPEIAAKEAKLFRLTVQTVMQKWPTIQVYV